MSTHWMTRTLEGAAALLLLAGPVQAGPITYNFTIIADSSGPFSNIITPPSINAAGTVAFHPGLAAGGRGIFTGSGGPITTIADTSGPFNSLGPPRDQ